MASVLRSADGDNDNGQMKNEDEEVAINRRVSFHNDGGSAVAATSNRSTEDPDLPIFTFEQQQQSQSRPSSL
eukprot:scaffold5916_cov74-Skeletonema_dohrnii-CCMP3373.AAC.4